MRSIWNRIRASSYSYNQRIQKGSIAPLTSCFPSKSGPSFGAPLMTDETNSGPSDENENSETKRNTNGKYTAMKNVQKRRSAAPQLGSNRYLTKAAAAFGARRHLHLHPHAYHDVRTMM
jgi:hypothetical protein